MQEKTDAHDGGNTGSPHMRKRRRRRRRKIQNNNTIETTSEKRPMSPGQTFATDVLSPERDVYGNKFEAVRACTQIINTSQINQAYVVGAWLFDTVDGAIIVANAVIRACADMGMPFMLKYRRAEKMMSSRGGEGGVRAAKEEDARVEAQVIRWEKNLCDLLCIKKKGRSGGGDDDNNNWQAQTVNEILGNALYTTAFEKARIDVRTTWRWTSQKLILCPWGREKPFHVIPVSEIDIRAKEALSALMTSRGFTVTGFFSASQTQYASMFRHNSVINEYLCTERGRTLAVVSFMLLLVANFREFSLGTPRENIYHYTSDELDCIRENVLILKSSLVTIKSIAEERARKERPAGWKASLTTLASSMAYVSRCYGEIISFGFPPGLFQQQQQQQPSSSSSSSPPPPPPRKDDASEHDETPPACALDIVRKQVETLRSKVFSNPSQEL